MHSRISSIAAAALLVLAFVLAGVHQIHVDSERNLYLTEVANSRSQMFRPKKNADPNRLVGPMAIVNPERTRK